MCEEQGGYLASFETKRENGYLHELKTEFNVLSKYLKQDKVSPIFMFEFHLSITALSV